MRKVKRLWVDNPADSEFCYIKTKDTYTQKILGCIDVEDLALLGIVVRPGQKKQIEIREVK